MVIKRRDNHSNSDRISFDNRTSHLHFEFEESISCGKQYPSTLYPLFSIGTDAPVLHGHLSPRDVYLACFGVISIRPAPFVTFYWLFGRRDSSRFSVAWISPPCFCPRRSAFSFHRRRGRVTGSRAFSKTPTIPGHEEKGLLLNPLDWLANDGLVRIQSFVSLADSEANL